MNASLEQIWKQFSGRLAQFIRVGVADPAASADTLQDVFVKIQARLGQLEHPERLQSWIFMVTRNAIVDHCRRQRTTEEVPESLAAEEVEPSEGEIVELKAAFLPGIASASSRLRAGHPDLVAQPAVGRVGVQSRVPE